MQTSMKVIIQLHVNSQLHLRWCLIYSVTYALINIFIRKTPSSLFSVAEQSAPCEGFFPLLVVVFER